MTVTTIGRQMGSHCSKCNSSDAATYYEDTGLWHCFSCEATYKGDNMEQEGETVGGFTNETFKREVVLDIQKTVRGISARTFKQYSYGKTDKGVHI